MPDDAFDPDAPAMGDGLYGLPSTPDDAAVVVVPVPWEATCSYRRGTSGGPEAVHAASMQVDLHDPETGDPWREGIAMEAVDPRVERWDEEAGALALEVIASGGVTEASPAHLRDKARRVDAIGSELNRHVHARTAALLGEERIPAILGGDHSVPFGAVQAAAERYPGVGILHLDAHADLRAAYEGFTWSHASIMYNIVTRIPRVGPLVQVGVRDLGHAERRFIEEHPTVTTWLEPDLAWEISGGEPWRRIAARIVSGLPDHVWLSFDIDGLDPALAPNTGTPVPGGLSWREICALLRVLGESGRRIVGMDLCEVAGNDEWDAIVGARLLYKMAGWALASRRK